MVNNLHVTFSDKHSGCWGIRASHDSITSTTTLGVGAGFESSDSTHSSLSLLCASVSRYEPFASAPAPCLTLAAFPSVSPSWTPMSINPDKVFLL